MALMGNAHRALLTIESALNWTPYFGLKAELEKLKAVYKNGLKDDEQGPVLMYQAFQSAVREIRKQQYWGATDFLKIADGFIEGNKKALSDHRNFYRLGEEEQKNDHEQSGEAAQQRKTTQQSDGERVDEQKRFAAALQDVTKARAKTPEPRPAIKSQATFTRLSAIMGKPSDPLQDLSATALPKNTSWDPTRSERQLVHDYNLYSRLAHDSPDSTNIGLALLQPNCSQAFKNQVKKWLLQDPSNDPKRAITSSYLLYGLILNKDFPLNQLGLTKTEKESLFDFAQKPFPDDRITISPVIERVKGRLSDGTLHAFKEFFKGCDGFKETFAQLTSKEEPKPATGPTFFIPQRKV